MFELKGGSKRYGTVDLFDGLDFTLKKGEIVSILGPSGCGKTTLLRIMCGLESLDGGTRFLNNVPLANGELHPGITMLFQQPVLYPHLSVVQNIGLGAPRKMRKQQRQSLPLTSSEPSACRVLKREELLNSREAKLNGSLSAEPLCKDPNSYFLTSRLLPLMSNEGKNWPT